MAPPRTYSSGHRPGYSYGYPSDYGYTNYSSRYEQLSYSAIRRNLRREGFSQVRLVDDLGDAYLIDAIDPQGIQVRLVVSSLDGQILEARARQSVSLAGGPPTGPIGAPGSFDDIGRGLEQAGYRSISVVEFDGRTYVVSAQDPRGPNVRLEIDGATGQLIRQSFF